MLCNRSQVWIAFYLTALYLQRDGFIFSDSASNSFCTRRRRVRSAGKHNMLRNIGWYFFHICGMLKQAVWSDSCHLCLGMLERTELEWELH